MQRRLGRGIALVASSWIWAARAAFAQPAPAQPVAAVSAPLARDSQPLAGYHDGTFYVRDKSDNFRIYPIATLLVDANAWLGEGVDERPELVPRLFVRAARMGLAGQVLEPLSFELTLAADRQPLANAQGDDQLAAAGPGQTPAANTARYADPQTAANSTTILDAWLNLAHGKTLNLRVGQYRVPFTAENSTELESLPFHERALAVRGLGAPHVRDIGASIWGDVDDIELFYDVGLFQGDGSNRPGVDRRWDVIGRATWRPLIFVDSPLDRLWVGASFRVGWRDGDRVNYDFVALRTQQQFVLWSPVYVDGLGRRTHIIPNDAQRALAFEIGVPFERLDLLAELVVSHDETREAVDGFTATHTERTGVWSGAAGYVLARYAILGPARLMGQLGPGVRPRTLDWSRADATLPEQSLEGLLRFELLSAEYASAARRGQADASGNDGDITVGAVGAGINYWATRHARLSFNWQLYVVPDTGSGNRARTPAAPGLGSSFHEIGVRLGLML